MKRNPLTTPAATRVAFIVIIVFVTAQMAWWIYFQVGYVRQVNLETRLNLEREASAINALLEAGANEVAEELLAAQPILQLDGSGARAEVDANALHKALTRQRRAVRMLAYEGPFFVLVVMTGLFIIARHIRLERELKQRQQNFLDAIGHEYRTPISALKLMIETLQLRDVSSERLTTYLGAMSEEVNRLERTGQQVLTAARMEVAAPPRPEPTDLSLLVKRVVARYEAAFAASNARIELEAPTVPVSVRATEDDVATLLGNLLDNALKYSKQSSEPVRVRLESVGEEALLTVIDSGPGIPPHERERVLERFYRVGNELTRESPGLGLGLHLVSRTAERLGGSVRLSQAAGGGTAVEVTLPLAETQVTGGGATGGLS